MNHVMEVYQLKKNLVGQTIGYGARCKACEAEQTTDGYGTNRADMYRWAELMSETQCQVAHQAVLEKYLEAAVV